MVSQRLLEETITNVCAHLDDRQVPEIAGNDIKMYVHTKTVFGRYTSEGLFVAIKGIIDKRCASIDPISGKELIL